MTAETHTAAKACGCTTDCGHDHTPQQDKAADAGQVSQFSRNEFMGVKRVRRADDPGPMRVRGTLR